MSAKRYLIFSLCVAVLAIVGMGACDRSSGEPSERELRIQYLSEHTREISINPANSEYGDLQGLGEAIGNARIVALGEATHGEGNVFEAKTRIIQYLVQEKGFEVISFESPLYDMHKALLNIQAGGDIDLNLEKSIFDIWTESSEFQPMLGLLGDLLNNGTGVIAGVDSDFSTLSSESLVDDLKGVLAGSNIDMNSPDWNRFETLLQELVETKWSDNNMDDSDKAVYDSLLVEIEDQLESGAGDLFWRQMVSSIEAESERRWIAKNGGPSNSVGGLRDLQMGDNLVWLAGTFYPDKKIILWAANIHAAREMSNVVALEDPDFPIFEYETIGGVAGEVFGEELYVISFTGLNGSYGRWFDSTSRQVGSSTDGSIESLLGAAGRGQTFLNLRNTGPDGSWLNERLVAKPFGYVEMEAAWPDVTDGFFFVRSVSRSTASD